MKKKRIQERLEQMEEHLRNAEAYIERNQNVVSSSWLHLKDWEGKSGHPLWMKNHMIPTVKKVRARDEKALERILLKERAKRTQDKRERNRISW